MVDFIFLYHDTGTNNFSNDRYLLSHNPRKFCNPHFVLICTLALYLSYKFYEEKSKTKSYFSFTGMRKQNTHTLYLVTSSATPCIYSYFPFSLEEKQNMEEMVSSTLSTYLIALALAFRFLASPLALLAVAEARAASSSGKSDVSKSGSSTASLFPSTRPTDWL